MSAALVALFPLATLLVVLAPGVAEANSTTQSNACLGVTGTFSTFAVPITGIGSPNPDTPPGTITLSGTSVSIGVDTTLIGAGVVTGLVSAADSLADIGAIKNDGTPSSTAGVDSVTGAAGSVTLKITGTSTTEGTQTASNTAPVSLTFYVTADSAGGSVVVYTAISKPPSTTPDPTRTGTVLTGALQVPIDLGNTTWTPNGNGNVAFSEAHVTPSTTTTPIPSADQTAAPLILLPKINGSINVPFHCWPGTASVDGKSFTAGSSSPIDTVTINGASSSSSDSSSSSSDSSSSSSESSSSSSQSSSSSSSSTSSSTPQQRFLPGGSSEFVYVCTGADPATTTLLNTLGGGTLSVNAKLATDPVAPSPDNGESFTEVFHWTLTLDQTLTETAANLGVTSVDVSDEVLTAVAISGASGPAVTGHPAPHSIAIAPGQPVSFNEGPFSGAFTRTSDIGQPVVFAPGPLAVTAGVNIGGTPLKLNLACTTNATAAQISLVDQAGTPPSTTTTSAGGSGPNVEAAELARTGYSPAFQLVLALTLLDLGYLVWSAARPPRARRRRFAV